MALSIKKTTPKKYTTLSIGNSTHHSHYKSTPSPTVSPKVSNSPVIPDNEKLVTSQLSESSTTDSANPSAIVIILSELNAKQRRKIYDALLLQRAPLYSTFDGKYTASVKFRVPASSYNRFIQDSLKNAQNISVEQNSEKIPIQGESQDDIERMYYFMTLRYSKFVGLIESRSTLTPNARSIPWLLSLIEEIYDARHAVEISKLEKNAEEKEELDMPLFVYTLVHNRHKDKHEADQECWDFVFNIEMLSSFTSSEEYKKDHKSIEIFAHFLDESYDSEDLLFFLASRFVVYNELEKRPSPNTKVARSVMLPKKVCFALVNGILSTLPQSLFDTIKTTLFIKIETHAENEWGIYEFLHLVLLEFRGFKSELQSATLNTTQEAPDNKEILHDNLVKFITETTGNDSLANEIFQQLNASVEKSVTKFMLSNADVKYLSDEATLLVHTQAESHFQGLLAAALESSTEREKLQALITNSKPPTQAIPTIVNLLIKPCEHEMEQLIKFVLSKVKTQQK